MKQIHSNRLSSPSTPNPPHHPPNSSPTVLKLGGKTGIPLFNAPTTPSFSNNASTSPSVSTQFLTRAYAMQLGLSTTLKNVCRRASDHDASRRAGSDALADRMCDRMGARASASAMPEARPRPA